MSEDFEGKDEGMDHEEEMPKMEENFGGMDEVTSDDKLWAFLTYVFTPLVPIIIMLMEDKKNRPFIKAHNAQALVWGIITFVAYVISSFICGVLGFILWLVGVYWGWQAYQGQEVNIPGITDFVKGQGWA